MIISILQWIKAKFSSLFYFNPRAKPKIIRPTGKPFISRFEEDFVAVSQFGEGGFGVVFEAKHKIDGRKYAVKRIPMPSGEEKREKVMREVKFLSSLEHPGIVRYYGSWIENPPSGWQNKKNKKGRRGRGKNSKKGGGKKAKARICIYIQMELCKKITLDDWLIDPKLRKQNEWLSIFKQILYAVDYMHEKNVIHRDLKPSNIFFSMNDTVKIGDFGLGTRILDGSPEGKISAGSRRKPARNIKRTNEVGTHIYMSPEQMQKQPYNHKVDIFSIGIILYELINMFGTKCERCIELEKLRRNGFPVKFQEKHPSECKILGKLLSRKPEDRPEAKKILQEKMFQS